MSNSIIQHLCLVWMKVTKLPQKKLFFFKGCKVMLYVTCTYTISGWAEKKNENWKDAIWIISWYTMETSFFGVTIIYMGEGLPKCYYILSLIPLLYFQANKYVRTKTIISAFLRCPLAYIHLKTGGSIYYFVFRFICYVSHIISYLYPYPFFFYLKMFTKNSPKLCKTK